MAAPLLKFLSNSLKKFSSATEKPEDFLSLQEKHANTFTSLLKSVYDKSKSSDGTETNTDALDNLIVKGFDDEQIWQQLELENNCAVSQLVSSVAKLVTHKAKCSFQTSGQQSLKTEKQTKNTKFNDTKALKQQEEEFKDSDYYEEELIDAEGQLEDNDSDLDDELDNIKSGLETADPDDKFFDFTGDSDEDLNFDFGPLSKKGDINDDLFGNEKKVGIGKGSKKNKKNEKKKSVTFDENQINQNKKQSVNKGKGPKFDKQKNVKGSIVDDKFFKLSELEEFLDREDLRETRRQKKNQGQEDDDDDDDSDEDTTKEDIDLFGDIDSDEEAHYTDFFDPPEGEVGEGQDADSEESEGDEEEEEEEDSEDDMDDLDDGEDMINEPRQSHQLDLLADSDSEGEDLKDILGGRTGEKSTFEKRQDKLKQKIASMEKDLLTEKSWQMAGEVGGQKRPENSLLQENLQFDYMTRLAPEITEETTQSLESIIIQRIKDKVWDDVERKVRKAETPYEYKKRVVLDQEKSKLSLGEIYEKEYLKQQETEEAEEKEETSHTEIKSMLQSLFLKLDALSNFHYTPKQAAPEVKIVTNQPSIAMEEVAPVAVSTDQLLAPQEIQEKQKGELKGQAEKTDGDKLRERKQKKKNKRERQKERERKQKLVEKLNPGLGNKYSKEKAMKTLEKESKSEKSGVKMIKEDRKGKTGLTSSKAFFTQLQDEVTTMIKTKQAAKRKKTNAKITDAKKLKL